MSHATAEYSIASLSATDLLPSSDSQRSWPTQKRSGVDSNLATMVVSRSRFNFVFADGQSVELDIRKGAESGRLWDLLKTINDLARLRPGWDSYGAKPLRRNTVLRVISTLFPILLREDVPSATIVPTRIGGLQFEWHRLGIDVEINIPPSGPFEYLIVDPGADVDIDGPDPVDESVIVSALRRMVPLN